MTYFINSGTAQAFNEQVSVFATLRPNPSLLDWTSDTRRLLCEISTEKKR